MQKIINRLLVAIILIIGILAAVTHFKMEGYKAKINELQTELVRANNLEPETVTVTQTEVQIKYKDRTITREIVPEGYISLDLARYRTALSKADSLKREVINIKRKVSALVVGTAESTKKKESYLGVIESLTTEIDKLREETSVIIEDTGKNDIIHIKSKGICFRPMIGGGYSSEMVPYIGVKLFYWGKMGLSLGSTTRQAGIALSRRISDIIPFTRNTELLFLIGEPYSREHGRFFVGAAVSL